MAIRCDYCKLAITGGNNTTLAIVVAFVIIPLLIWRFALLLEILRWVLGWLTVR